VIKRCDTFSPGAFFEKIRKWFEIEEIPLSVASLKRALARGGRAARRSVSSTGRRKPVVVHPEAGKRDEMGDDLHPSLKQLDVLVLSRFLLQRTLASPWRT